MGNIVYLLVIISTRTDDSLIL